MALISMMRDLKFFLRLKMKQIDKGIYIHQTKYVNELLKKFKMVDVKEMKTHMHSTTHLELDEESKKEDGTQYKGMI